MSADLPENYYRVSIKGLIYDTSRTKFLLVQESDGFWALPGGGLDHGESPHDCLAREIKEEMGLSVTSISERPAFFLSSRRRHSDLHWVVNVLYETTLINLDFTPTNECVAVRYVTAEEARALRAYPAVHKFADMFRDTQEK